MKTEIVSIGNEILTGEISNTNAEWLARELGKIFVKVIRIVAIEDDIMSICDALEQSKKNADLVVVSGGLGVTSDDVTKKAICRYFNTGLKQDIFLLNHIRKVLELKKIGLKDNMLNQAYVPARSTIYFNDFGTAPCIRMEDSNTVFFFLPGVPYELKNLVHKSVLPDIKRRVRLFTKYKNIDTRNITEADLSEIIARISFEEYKGWSIAYLLQEKGVRITVSVSGEDLRNIERKIAEIANKIRREISQFVISCD